MLVCGPLWKTLHFMRHLFSNKLVEEYPIVAKAYRDDVHQKPVRRHHCQASLVEGLGYEDLNQLMQNPQDLEFIFEILKVEQPGEYEKEIWQISNDSKLELIPKLKEEGNNLYKNEEYEKAIEKYQLALTFIDQLQLREKPRDLEWNQLNDLKIPFLLNTAQCKMYLKDFYAAIENCNQVLQSDPNNIKALFRRGKAHMKTWNLEEAKSDLTRVAELDENEKNAVQTLMTELKKIEQESKELEKSMLKTKLF